MREVHSGRLWIGHAEDARQPRRIHDAEIAAVVDVAFEEIPAQLPRQLIYCRFPIVDGGGNESNVILHSVQTVVRFLHLDTPTLVACSAGKSRSPTIAAFALAAFLTEKPEDVLARIAKTAPLEVSGVLWQEVLGAVRQNE